MRRGSVALILLLLCKSASAQIGPPEPRAPAGGYSLGVGVHNVHSEWTYDYTVSRNRVYLEGSLGLGACAEVFGRVGASNFVINDVETFQPGMLRDVSSDGYPAFLSGGIRGTPWMSESWSIGISLEVAVYSGMEKTVRWTHDTYQELHFDPTVEINAGISVGYHLDHGVLYAGPLIHFGYAMADVRTHTFGDEWNIRDHIDGLTVRDKPGMGGFLGWQCPIGECGWAIQLEGSVLRGGFGGAISFFRAW